MTIMCLIKHEIHDSTCVNTDSIYIVYFGQKAIEIKLILKTKNLSLKKLFRINKCL